MQSILAPLSVTLTLLLCTLSSAAPTVNRDGLIAQITSELDWCMMLPPKPSMPIAPSENAAVAFCTQAPGAHIFPENFIRSAHFKEDKARGYVQITGTMDRSKYGILETDAGGQYDTVRPVAN